MFVSFKGGSQFQSSAPVNIPGSFSSSAPFSSPSPSPPIRQHTSPFFSSHLSQPSQSESTFLGPSHSSLGLLDYIYLIESMCALFSDIAIFRRLKRHEPQYLGAFSFRPGFSWYTTHPSGLWPLCWVFSSQTRTGGSPQSIKTVGSQLETHSSGWLPLGHVILTRVTFHSHIYLLTSMTNFMICSFTSQSRPYKPVKYDNTCDLCFSSIYRNTLLFILCAYCSLGQR